MDIKKRKKRLFDILCSAVLLIVLSPIFALIGVVIFLTIGSPVIFRQERPGLDENIFIIYKFRTMLSQPDLSFTEDKSEISRITCVGKFLRSTSLDELPELWNILKGEMSFVGPRPLLVEYLPLYSEEQSKRHSVKPGLTGWAQINGRNAISWQEKFKLDVWYVENQSFELDMRILYLTFIKVFAREDINAGEGVTMPPFTGKN